MERHKKMSEIIIQIDGKEVEAAEGMTILEAAQKADIFIPTLCHHEKLEPYGACRLCTVEVEVRSWTSLVAACLYPVEKYLVVKTRSEKVDKIRKMILEFLLAHAPCSPQPQEFDLPPDIGPGIVLKFCWKKALNSSFHSYKIDWYILASMSEKA
jgi:hypothetical protein